MTDEMLKAFVGAWSRPDANSRGGKRSVLYAVLASTAEEAEDLILEHLGLPNADVTIQHEPLADSAVHRKDLRPREVIELSSGR